MDTERDFNIYGIINPFSSSSTVTGEDYVEILQDSFQSAVADWLLTSVWRWYFLEDKLVVMV